MKWVSFLFVITFLLSGCQSKQVPIADSKQASGSEQMLSAANWYTTQVIYTPSDWPQALTAEVIHPAPQVEGLPIMLLVHGGGWQRRSLDDMQSMASYWSKRGFITVNIGYRFAPEYQFPAQLHDVQQAMHWIDSQRTAWNAEHSSITAFGFSSGAHLVSLMASVANQPTPLNSPYGGVLTRPDKVIAGGIPSDLQKWQSGRLIEDFLGGTQNELADVYRMASPIEHVHQHTPPTFLFHGRLDRLVPSDHASDYYQALKDHQVDTELHWLSLRGHMTSFIFKGSALRAAEAFMAKH